MTAMRHHHAIGIRRVYDPPVRGDGLRILIDRLWPRGLKKAAAAIDLWLKEAVLARNCAVGLAMTQRASMSLKRAMLANSERVPRS